MKGHVLVHSILSFYDNVTDNTESQLLNIYSSLDEITQKALYLHLEQHMVYSQVAHELGITTSEARYIIRNAKRDIYSQYLFLTTGFENGDALVGLSERTKNCLKRSCIMTREDIVANMNRIHTIRGIGPTSLKEIITWLDDEKFADRDDYKADKLKQYLISFTENGYIVLQNKAYALCKDIVEYIKKNVDTAAKLIWIDGKGCCIANSSFALN